MAPRYGLTHWGRVTHICVGKLTIIGSDNGLSPGRRQAIIWTNAGILLIGPLRTNFSEILSEIQSFSFKKMHLKMSSAKCRPFCFGLNVLTPFGARSSACTWIMALAKIQNCAFQGLNGLKLYKLSLETSSWSQLCRHGCHHRVP